MLDPEKLTSDQSSTEPSAANRGPVPFPPLVAQSLEVSLTSSDLPRSRDWYRDTLQFIVDREFSRDGQLFAVRLRAGGIRILLTQDDGSRGRDRAKGGGFSIQLTTSQDIDAIAAHAKQGGATLDSEPADMRGARAFRLRDPDGFRWTVSSPRDQTTIP